MLHQRVRFVDIADNGVNGVDALVCASRDENCDSPLAKVTTSGGGYAIVQVPKNFRGTMQVKDPPPGKDFMKIKAYFFPAIAMDDNLTRPVPGQKEPFLARLDGLKVVLIGAHRD